MTRLPDVSAMQFMFGPVNRIAIPLSLVVEIPNVHRYIFPLRTRQRDTPGLRVEMAVEIASHLRPRWREKFPAETTDDNLVKYVSEKINHAWREKDMTLSWDEQGRASLHGQNFGCVGHTGNFFVLLEGR